MDVLNTISPGRNNSSNGLLTPALDDHSLQAEAKEAGMFGLIAALSFLLNSLFCVIMMKKPAMLKRPHNILLFSLAITDLLTGLYGFIKANLTGPKFKTICKLFNVNSAYKIKASQRKQLSRVQSDHITRKHQNCHL